MVIFYYISTELILIAIFVSRYNSRTLYCNTLSRRFVLYAGGIRNCQKVCSRRNYDYVFADAYKFNTRDHY